MTTEPRVLVTGGRGFIGSNVVESLVEHGCRVRILDNFSRAYQHARIPQDVEVVRGDIRNTNMVRKSVRDIDTIIHLAALTEASESYRHPLLYRDVNATGTLNLLNASANQGVKRFVLASSSAVYGRPAGLPISEETPVAPLSPYAASKLAAENSCHSFAIARRLKCVVLRLFNVYGRLGFDGYSGVVTEFVNQVVKGESPVIFGTGLQSRDFIHISEVVQCIARASSFDLGDFEILNIGTGKETTIRELAETIISVTGRNGIKPVRADARAGEIDSSVADTQRLGRLLGFKSSVDLRTGLKRLMEEQMRLIKGR